MPQTRERASSGEATGDDLADAEAQLKEWGLFGGLKNKGLLAWKADFKDETDWKFAVVEGVAGRLTGTHELKSEGGKTKFVRVG